MELRTKVFDENHKEFRVNGIYITFWYNKREFNSEEQEFYECLVNDLFHDDDWYGRVDNLLLLDKVYFDRIETKVLELAKNYTNKCEEVEQGTFLTKEYKEYKESK